MAPAMDAVIDTSPMAFRIRDGFMPTIAGTHMEKRRPETKRYPLTHIMIECNSPVRTPKTAEATMPTISSI